LKAIKAAHDAEVNRLEARVLELQAEVDRLRFNMPDYANNLLAGIAKMQGVIHE
jgi:cell division protein FtsB